MRGNSRSTSRNKKLRVIVLLGVVALLLLFFAPRVISLAASLVLSPMHAIEYWFVHSSASFPYYLRDRAALIDEIGTLQSNNAAQSGERYTLELLHRENDELRALLHDAQEARIVAGVIGRPNKLPYDVLVVDKGSDDGVVEGAPVFASENSVIGMVQKVFRQSSVVELITSPNFSTSVYIFGPDIYTTAIGQGGGQLRVGVPQGIDLNEGDLVILPSASTGVYGKISVIDSVPTRPEQYGYVSPDVPISSLRLVAIGDAPLEPVSFEEAQAAVLEARREVFSIPVPEDVLVTAHGSSTATSTGTTSVQEVTATSTEL